VTLVRERRGAYRIFVGKREGKRPFGRLRHKWEDNIKMSHRYIGWEGVECMYLPQAVLKLQSLVTTVMNLRLS